jgi:transposase
MGGTQAACGQAFACCTRQGPAAQTRFSYRDQWHAVRPQDGLPVAHAADRLSALEDGIWVPTALASRRHLGCSHACVARGSTAEGGTQCGTIGRYHRLALGQECLKRGQRGFDAGKKTKGRKQHIAVDTLGFILAVVVHSAGIQDRTGARAVLIRLFGIITNFKKIYVDGGYAGKLLAWSHAMFGWVIEVVKRNESGKFVVLPKRWIVERTFAWLAQYRRLNRDYEISPRQSEALIKLAMIRLMLKRLV